MTEKRNKTRKYEKKRSVGKRLIKTDCDEIKVDFLLKQDNSETVTTVIY